MAKKKEEVEEVVEEVGQGTSSDEAICLYHKTEQPRVFEAGENIPKGWNIENRKYWTVTDNGKFVNVND